MHDSRTDDYVALVEELLKESKALHDRVEESIRKSEDQLRAAKATLNELREKLRHIA